MQLRLVAGIGILIAVLVVFPALALPDIRDISSAPRTGTAWVTLHDINGSGTSENLTIAYAVGDVSEIPLWGISENQTSGLVTVTLKNSTPERYFIISSKPAIEGSYVVNTVTVENCSEPLLVNSMDFAVVSSTANYYADIVPDGKQHEWVDLDWKDPGMDLSLMIYAPDGMFGPYTDMSDGRRDGRIFLDVASRLNVTPGHWFFKVQNERQDRIPYTLNTYSA